MSVFTQCAQLLTGPATKPMPTAAAQANSAATSSDDQHSLERELASIQRHVLARTGRHISIAAARTTVVARTASRLPDTSRLSDICGAQPTGVCVVPAGTERAFLAPLPLQHLHGVPAPTLRLLQASGLVTIGQLQRVPKAALQAAFGASEGLHLWRSARGLDSLPRNVQPGFRGWLTSRNVARSRKLSAFGNFSASAGQHRIRGLVAQIARHLAF